MRNIKILLLILLMGINISCADHKTVVDVEFQNGQTVRYEANIDYRLLSLDDGCIYHLRLCGVRSYKVISSVEIKK